MFRNRTYQVTITDPTLNRPLGPTDTAISDHRTRLLSAEQDALRDANSQGLDQTLIQYWGSAPLPTELEAQERLVREQAAATKMLKDAQSVGEALSETGKVSVTANGPGIPRNYETTIPRETEIVAKVEGQIEKVETKREALVAILDGEQRDSEGISWTGHAPAQPGPDTKKSRIFWSAANVKDKVLTWLPLLVLGPVEAAIVVTTLMVYLRTDDPVAPFALGVAFLVGLIFLPGQIGTSLAKVYRRGFALGKEIWAISAMGLLWVAAVASTVYFRVTADQASAISKAAKAQNLPLDRVNAEAAYSMPVHVAAWLVPVGIIGFVVIVAKVLWHNPVLHQVIKLDYGLVDLYRSRFCHSSIKERAEAQIAAREAGTAAAVDEWTHYRDEVLPANCAEFCRAYRNWLSVHFANPNITNGLYPKEA